MADDQTAFAYENPALAPIRRRESGSQNIANRQGPGGTPASTASGYYQIVDSTWNEGLKLAGIDPSQYPSAMSAPAIVQVTVANALHDKYGDRPWAASSTMDQLGGGYNADMVNRTMGDIGGLFRQQQAAQAPILADMQQRFKQDQIRFDKAAEDYTPIHETQAPPPPPTDPLKGFASVGAIFAAIASGFTHTPAINAMNGMAAAINATKRNDWEQYEAGYRQWKDNTEIAIQHHKLQAEDMRNAMEMMTTNLAAGAAMAHAVAAQTQDEIALRLLSLGKYEELAKLQDSRERTASEIQARSKEIEARDLEIRQKRDMDAAITNLSEAHKSGDPQRIAEANQAVQDQLMRNPTYAAYSVGLRGQTTPVEKEREFQQRLAGKVVEEEAKTGGPVSEQRKAEIANDLRLSDKTAEAGAAAKARTEATSNAKPLSDDAAYNQARYYLRTGQIPAGFGGQAMRTQIIERATSLAKAEGHTIDDYITGQATYRADQQSLAAVTKQKNAAEGYERGALKAFDLMVSLTPKTAEPMDMQTLTRWVRTGETEFGDVSVPPWQAALITALDQYAKVLSGATGAQGSTDSARSLALSLIPAGSTSGQIPGIVNVIKKDMAFKVAGYDEQITNIQSDIRGGGGIKPPAAPTETQPTESYSSADSVKQAFHDGKLSKDQAVKILRDKFGMQ